MKKRLNRLTLLKGVRELAERDEDFATGFGVAIGTATGGEEGTVPAHLGGEGKIVPGAESAGSHRITR